MNDSILIVGGGPAGLAAAHALARVGRRSVLVDKADRLGGAPILSGYAKLVPSGEWAKDAIGGMVERVRGDSRVEVHTGTTVRAFDGSPGDFTAQLSDGATVRAGAAILATGFTHFDSLNKPEWGFGTFPDVVTTTQVEQMISSGRGVHCPSDGRKPQRVAILLCVGSRDRQIGREWCSKICCTVSANLAMEIREELPDCHVYISSRDIRTFGLYVKRPVTIPFDLVVHAIGMDPNVDNQTIASTFGVALEPHGYLARRNAYGNMAETSRAGVFVAGAASGPETIDDSIGQGHAAALTALGSLGAEKASA
jgi:heterodisulfide reductase subunit A